LNKRTVFAALSAVVVSAFLLTGCATATGSGSTGSDIDLTSTSDINSLCGDEASETLGFVEAAQKADPDSGKRNALKDWGVTDPTDDDALTEIVGALKVRAAIKDCSEDPTDTASEAGTVGVESLTGDVGSLPLVTGTDATVVIDTTTQAATPPLLDGSLRFTAQTLSWAGLVERVGSQQWYIDGVNARAAQTGFTWDDVLKFAQANKMVDGKIQGVNALAIQVFNRPDLTDAQARDEVRKYITPDVEATIGMTVEQLPIQWINNGFVNTRQAGTAESPSMGEYFDTQRMVRVSLMPIKFDDKGTAISLDGSRGAGIFIDCGNLHWVPKAVWTCKTDGSCDKPQCPAGMTGTPPNCATPPPPPSGCVTDCGNDSKDWSKSPNNGWTPLGPGPLTDGHQSQDQQDSGETSGNVIDNPVPEGTESDDTTTDLPEGTVTAPGATEGGDDQSGGGVDEENTNQNGGGTNGDTCVPDTVAGITC